MAGWADYQIFSDDPRYNNMGGSVAWVANSTARTALETSFTINGVITIPNGLIVGDLDTGNIYGWYSVSAIWKFLGGTSTVTGSGSAGAVAYWTSASVLAATPLTYAAGVFTFPGNIKIPYNRGILDQGSNFIVGVGDVLPPFTNTVMLGSTALPTYIRGTEFYVACSESPGPGTATFDVDLGVEFSVLNQLTTGGRAFRVRDRAGSPLTYLDCLISTTLGNKGLTFSNGMGLYFVGASVIDMGFNQITNMNDGVGAYDAATVGQISGMLGNYLALSGGTMSGDIAMGGNKVTGLGAATTAGDALPYGQDFVASGASHKPGGVPDPGASAGSTKFLREDATWAVPPGGSGATAVNKTVADSPYNASAGENVFVDASGGAVIVNLPAATGTSGIVSVKKVDSSANAVTVTANTGGTPDTIDGSATQAISTQYTSITMQDAVADKWYII